MQGTIGVWSPTLQEVRSHSVLASLSVSILYFRIKHLLLNYDVANPPQVTQVLYV